MSIFDGRGRWTRWGKKEIVGDYLQLDAQAVARQNDLTRPGYRGWRWSWSTVLGGARTASINFRIVPGEGIELEYQYAGEPVPVFMARIVTTTPNYGGRRYWFMCPGCGRRVRYLYGGRLFHCRTCHGLTYATTQTGKNDLQPTITNRINQIRRRLGEPGDPLGKFPDRPRYMHMSTYMRLWREYVTLQQHYMDFWNARLLAFAGMIDRGEVGELRARWLQYRRTGKRLALWQPTIRPSPYLPATDDEGSPAADGLRNLPEWKEPEEWRAFWRQVERNDPRRRLTLGELARAAGVPYTFAKEAQRERMITPDGGRGTRVHRYRRRLATWLGKLHRYRAAGMEWEAIRDWSRRRWQPGNEHERGDPVEWMQRKGVIPMGDETAEELIALM